TVCQKCHEEQYNKTLDSVHMRAVAAGEINAAICTDCHNPHTQPVITDQNGALLPKARLRVPETCARCHNAIYETYKQSVHGAALTQEGNTDVPTCIDCHGVHNIADPTTNAFRLQSPQICAKCHTDPAIMDKYGISTQVLNSYVADFHGTTVTLFEKITPDQATNKPVCFDCHGVHDIKRVDDPVYGLQMKQNLLKACQRCHPDATTNFPDAWMSHYIPSPTHDALVYYVNLFYKFFIPGVIGSMVIYVVSDIVRRLIERLKGAKHA
ncbi:MAG: multiheme c-type cytochrome, partial [Chloroflexi bacterium]|nr:multiheme c-type cytochrome [Chloroflexota bacterium]